MEITTARLAILGPRKGQIFVFDRPSMTVARAKPFLKKGQRLVVVTISWDDPPQERRSEKP